MNVTQMMSAMADAAGQRYGMLIEGFKGLYSRALDDADFGTARQLNRVVADAYAMAHLFLAGETVEIEDALEEIAQQALTATREELGVTDADELPDDINEHVSDFESYLINELSIQIERDIAFLKKALRNIYLVVTVASRAQGLPLRTALLQLRIGSATDVEFHVRDRRGARWPSRRFVRSTWRHNLLAAYNDIVLMTLADHGVDVAQIKHTDPTSTWHGMEVAMTPQADMPTYAEVRDDAFHPNSEAVLVRAV
jgi:hypothetical protein